MANQNKANDWYGSTIQTDGVPMVNDGTGRPMVLEVFEFAIKPGQQFRPTEQQLFNAHWPYLKDLIWSKGLVANQDITPRVVIGKKRYRIFILCEPKFRHVQVQHEKPRTLQDIFNNPKK